MGQMLSESSNSCCTRETLFASKEAKLEDMTAATKFEHDPEQLMQGMRWEAGLGLILSHGATHIASHDPFSGLQRWKINTCLQELKCVAYSPERKLLFAGGKGLNEIVAYNTEHKMEWEAESGISVVYALQWSSEIDMLLAAGIKEIAIIDPSDGACQWSIAAGFYDVRCLCWCPRLGTAFIGGSYERFVIGMIVSVEPRNNEPVWAVKGDKVGATTGGVKSMCLDTDQSKLFCGGNNSKVVCLEPSTSKRLWTSDVQVGQRAAFGSRFHGVTALQWADMARIVIAAGDKGRMAGLDPDTGDKMWIVNTGIGRIWHLAYVPDLRMSVCSGDNVDTGSQDPFATTHVIEDHVEASSSSHDVVALVT